MLETTVKMGEREYTLQKKPIKQNRAWRVLASQPLDEVLSALGESGDIEINTVSDVANLLSIGRNVIIGSMDIIADLLFAYCPEMAADKDWIESECYDDDVIDAFSEVLKIAFPFAALRGLVTGPKAITTTQS